MKNTPNYVKNSLGKQKGFASILLILLAVAVIVGGVYLYINNNDYDKPFVMDNISSEDMKKAFPDKQISKPEVKDTLSLNIPSNIKQNRLNNTELHLIHAVPYRHANLCDMKGDAPMQENFVDYSNVISIYDGNFTQIVQKVFPHSLATDFVDSNGRPNDFFETLIVNSREVYKTSMGVEGCGYYIYIIPFDNKAVVIRKEFVPPFESNFTEETINEFKNINGVIKPEEADIIFNNILIQIIDNLPSN